MADPTIPQLRIFETSVRMGSFSAASRALGITQQSASSAVRALERVIGLELVHRSPGGVMPTKAGEIVLAASQEVLSASDRLQRAVINLREESRHTLSVGASQTIASHFLPAWLLKMRRTQLADTRPETTVRLQTANSETVIAQVRAGLVDLGFIETPEIPVDLGSRVVQEEHLVAAVSSSHPWAKRSHVALEEIASTPLVSREKGSGTRAALEAAVRQDLGATVVTPNLVAPILVLATEAAIRSAVTEGVGPAVLSRLSIEDDVRLGRIFALPIRPRPVTRPLTALWRGSVRDLTSPQRELIEIAMHSTEIRAE